MAGLVTPRQRSSVADHAVHAHAFGRAPVQAGQQQMKPRQRMGAEDDQLPPVGAALRRTRSLGIGHVGRHHFGAPAFRRQRRATDFKHAKQIHEVVPPELIASERVWNWPFNSCTPRLNFICVSASSRLSRSTLTLLPSGRSMSPLTACATGVKDARSSLPLLLPLPFPPDAAPARSNSCRKSRSRAL